jgi:deazaflavin-dependent oxidoreductase (nitroreductase family)
MRLPRWLARFNRVGPNRVMRLWAPYVPPLAVVTHIGRSSGRVYRTPVMAFPSGDRVVIALTYGETDWSRNVLAGGDAQLTRLGRTRRMSHPRLTSSAEELPAGTRWTVRVFGKSLIADLG